MKWGFAPMIDIPEEEREKYPNSSGDFYERRIDMDNTEVFDEFISGMGHINEIMKEKSEALHLR